MERNLPPTPGKLRLGGLAGILAGLCVLTFALVSESRGLLFTPDVLTGGSIGPWIERMHENARLARLLPALPIIGFSSMLVVGITLYRLINLQSWQKNLAIAGYLIGVPVAVAVFVAHLSVINQLLTLSSQSESLNDQIQTMVAFHMHHFMYINYAVGPFFIIILGNTGMAWAALQTGFLPKWLCFWAFFNGGLLLIGLFSVFFPALQFAQIGGPITMVWFITTGVILLKKSNGGYRV